MKDRYILRSHPHIPGRYRRPFTNSFWRNLFVSGGLGKSEVSFETSATSSTSEKSPTQPPKIWLPQTQQKQGFWCKESNSSPPKKVWNPKTIYTPGNWHIPSGEKEKSIFKSALFGGGWYALVTRGNFSIFVQLPKPKCEDCATNRFFVHPTCGPDARGTFNYGWKPICTMHQPSPNEATWNFWCNDQCSATGTFGGCRCDQWVDKDVNETT